MQQARTNLAFIYALWSAAAIHACITCAYALVRLYTYKASLLDIGVFDQVLWNILHHNAPLTTATVPFIQQHWLGFHFSPILYALAPFYALWPHPETLLVIQSLCFAAAGIPLFYAACALGLKPLEAAFVALLYWSNPYVLSATLWDFHEITFSCLFISLAVWAFCVQHFRALASVLFLLLLTKEHYGLCVAGFGLLWAIRYRDWKRGGLLIAMGLSALFIILKLLVPLFHGGEHSMLSTDGSVASRYGWLTAPWNEKLATFHQLFFGADATEMTGFLYLTLLLLSGLILPVFAPLMLAPATADVLANLLSFNPMPRHHASYHTAAVIPVILMAAMYGYTRLCQWWPTGRVIIAAVLVALSFFFPVTGLTFYSLHEWELAGIAAKQNTSPISDITALTGKEPLVTQANIGVFFSQRAEIYPFPHKLDTSRWVVLHLASPFRDPYQQHFNIPYGMDTAPYLLALNTLMHSSDWHIAYWNAPWLVMERGNSVKDESQQRGEIATAITHMAEIKAH